MTVRVRTPAAFDTLLDRTVGLGYSRLGFGIRRRHWPADDPPADGMSGRTALVTGANSGIGFAIATALADLGGGAVVLAVRDEDRGARARRAILAAHPGADISVIRCDVSSSASIEDCAATVLDRHLAIDVLVHNAGVLPERRTETAEGHEITLATHVLGPLLLTELLAPALAAAPDPRVVLMSSGGMYTQRLAVDDPEYRRGRYRGTTAYARTKRMQVALAPILAERYAPQGISVHCMHPGWVDTPGVASSLPAFRRLTRRVLRTPEEGADTAVWLAATTPAPPSGHFWHDRAPRPDHYVRLTRNPPPEDVHRLWTYCAQASGLAE